MPRTLTGLLLLALAVGCGSRAEAPPKAGFTYPAARTVDVSDDFHGTRVADPYRWMEENDNPELKTWIDQQNRITNGWLQDGSDRSRIRRRLAKLWNYERYGVPQVEGGRYVFRRNSGLQNQAVLYIADALDAEPRVLLDPNTLSEDGTVALRRTYFSPDGRHMVYSTSSGGSDWKEFRVREVSTGEDLPGDVLTNIKFSSAAWNAEGSGFYYARHGEPAGDKLTAKNDAPKIYYHSLGTTQDEDVLVYERPDQPDWGLYPWVTEDGRYLVVYVSKGSSGSNALYLKDLELDGEVKPFLPAFDARYSVLGNDGPLFYIYTDNDAPNGRVVKIDARETDAEKWVSVVPESKQTIESISLVGGQLFVHRLRFARSQVTVFGLDGKELRKVDLPGLGSVYGFNGRRSDTETFFAYSSFTSPSTIYRYDITSGEVSVFRQPKVDFKPDNYFTRQVSYASKDGTRVTMFISHRRGLILNGKNPVMLYGYGGFNNSMTPYFSVSNLVWMEMGGVLAVPNLRGGGEYGEAWHEAGMLENKQNVFDDFIAAAESLVYNKYSNPKRIAIAGGSNGGLLVGACLNQRPELFAAAIPSVGVMDMLRYHRFTIGRFWISEYGSAEDPKMFPTLYAYSPYHNIRNIAYPAVMVTTGDHDDRVVPAHSFKYAARLQQAQKGPAPILIRVETRGGHGAGTPTSKRIDAAADQWTFLARNLRMRVRFRG